MGKKEREQRINAFWDHYAPMRTNGPMDKAMAEWLFEDDCLTEDEYKRLTTPQPNAVFAY